MIISLSPPYFRAVAEAHVSLDPTAFLSEVREVGVAFREEIFYPTLADDPNSFVWIYLTQGSVAGYIAGTKDLAPLYKRLKRARPFRLGGLLLEAGFQKPILFVKYFQLEEALKKTYFSQPIRAEILSFGVLPEFRSREFERTHGVYVAGALFQKAVETFRQWGVRQFKVMTVQANEAANRFYERQGCRKVGTVKPQHFVCNVFVGEVPALNVVPR